MNLFTRWAKREYPLWVRLLAVLPAGALFLILIPWLLLGLGPQIDAALSLPRFYFGLPNLVTGGLLAAVGVVFGVWSNAEEIFRARGTPLPVMPTQVLLVRPPFDRTRNPMSFGALTLYLGAAVAAGSLASLGIFALLAALLITYLKRVEERELEARFGQAYLEYKARTPFLIPRVGRKSSRKAAREG